MAAVATFLGKLLAAVILLLALIYWYMLVMPGRSHTGALPPLSDDERDLGQRLRRHVVAIASRPHNTDYPEELEAAARYIEDTLMAAGYTPIRQEFPVRGITVRNIEVVIAPGREIRAGQTAMGTLVVGAHYDSAGDVPGANDNGSGAAALLEIARLLKSHTIKQSRLRLVFFVNEEPPQFKTDKMGSLVYARALAASGENVRGMLSLETLGYYSDMPGSQQYPPPLNLVLPDTGNFVAIVGSLATRRFVAEVTRRFRETTPFPSIGGVAPAFLPGIDWSDHWSFGQVGIPAAMVTDTALFRYHHYHKVSDTPDKVDYDKLARVTAGLARMIGAMAR